MSSKSILRIHSNITHEKNNEYEFWLNFSFLNIKKKSKIKTELNKEDLHRNWTTKSNLAKYYKLAHM